MSIVRIQKPEKGWEIIPNEFVNDFRLSVDAVAVGIWLACKPQNWQVRPSAIQTEFSGRPGKPRGGGWGTRAATARGGGVFDNLIIEPSITRYLPQLKVILQHAGIADTVYAQELFDELAG